MLGKQESVSSFSSPQKRELVESQEGPELSEFKTESVLSSPPKYSNESMENRIDDERSEEAMNLNGEFHRDGGMKEEQQDKETEKRQSGNSSPFSWVQESENRELRSDDQDSARPIEDSHENREYTTRDSIDAPNDPGFSRRESSIDVYRERTPRDYQNPMGRGREYSRSDNPSHRGPLQGEPKPCKILGFFGLSSECREKDLRSEVERYAPCNRLLIIYDAQTGESRRFGFAYFDTVEDAMLVRKNMNGIRFMNRHIRVDFSVTDRPRSPQPGGHRPRPMMRQDDRYNRMERRPIPRPPSHRYDERGLDRPRLRSVERYDDRRGPSRSMHRSMGRSRSRSPYRAGYPRESRPMAYGHYIQDSRRMEIPHRHEYPMPSRDRPSRDPYIDRPMERFERDRGYGMSGKDMRDIRPVGHPRDYRSRGAPPGSSGPVRDRPSDRWME